MITRLMQWVRGRKKKAPVTETATYTYDQVRRIAEEYGEIRYNDGKRDGLDLARKQATKSLKEILQWQNANQ